MTTFVAPGTLLAEPELLQMVESFEHTIPFFQFVSKILGKDEQVYRKFVRTIVHRCLHWGQSMLEYEAPKASDENDEEPLLQSFALVVPSHTRFAEQKDLLKLFPHRYRHIFSLLDNLLASQPRRGIRGQVVLASYTLLERNRAIEVVFHLCRARQLFVLLIGSSAATISNLSDCIRLIPSPYVNFHSEHSINILPILHWVDTMSAPRARIEAWKSSAMVSPFRITTAKGISYQPLIVDDGPEMFSTVRLLVRGFEDDPVWYEIAGRNENSCRHLLELLIGGKASHFYASVGGLVGLFEIDEETGLVNIFESKAGYVVMPPGISDVDIPGFKGTIIKEALSRRLPINVLWRLDRASILHRGEMKTVVDEESRFYVIFVAVDPETRGQGLGSLIFQNICGRADTSGAEVFLENSKERNLNYYQRHGLVVVRQVMLEHSKKKDAPMLWLMTRLPKMMSEVVFTPVQPTTKTPKVSFKHTKKSTSSPNLMKYEYDTSPLLGSSSTNSSPHV